MSDDPFRWDKAKLQLISARTYVQMMADKPHNGSQDCDQAIATRKCDYCLARWLISKWDEGDQT